MTQLPTYLHITCSECLLSCSLLVTSPGSLSWLPDPCLALRYLSVLTAVVCSIFLFFPGAIGPPSPPSSFLTSFSALLLEVSTRSISCWI